MITTAAYCSREQVKSALNVKQTARNNDQVDRAIESARNAVEGLLHRSFLPVVATRYFPWPQRAGSSYRLWLNENELISLTTLASGGTTIASGDYFLEPNTSGPPYDRIELDLDSSASFGVGSTPQRDIAVTGVWGYKNETASSGTISEALDSSETGVDVTVGNIARTGDVVMVDNERMIVTDISFAAADFANALTASVSDVTVTVLSGANFRVGEIIQIDSEFMLVVAISSNALTVKRAWDGSTLASHAGSAVVRAVRSLSVTRGALGTTAVAHDTGTNLFKQLVPPLVVNLAVAESLNYMLQETGGYSPSTGSGGNTNNLTGGGLDALRIQAYAQFGRQARMRSV